MKTISKTKARKAFQNDILARLRVGAAQGHFVPACLWHDWTMNVRINFKSADRALKEVGL